MRKQKKANRSLRRHLLREKLILLAGILYLRGGVSQQTDGFGAIRFALRKPLLKKPELLALFFEAVVDGRACFLEQRNLRNKAHQSDSLPADPVEVRSDVAHVTRWRTS